MAEEFTIQYEVRVNSAKPRGNASKYGRFYKHIALVVTDGRGSHHIRDTAHCRIIRHVPCICLGSTSRSRGYRILAKYERLAARANRLLAFRRRQGGAE